MKIIRGWSNKPERSVTDPLLEDNGLWIEFRGGDVCDPFFGNWFEPPWPKLVWRWYCQWPILPWISWKLGKKGGYIGFKAYGADNDPYINWIKPPSEVYPGSQALCFSIRPFASIE